MERDRTINEPGIMELEVAMPSWHYKDLVTEIKKRTGFTKKDIRLVLETFTEVLTTIPLGSWTKTPLGTFRPHYTKSRTAVLPDRETTTPVKEKIVIRLKPSRRLRRLASD
jgi:nucleoid DNA-binding protein